MCGIIGKIGGKYVKPESFLDSLSHRGPDNIGFFEENNIMLGHTRLSIQDLSENGNQPMFSADNRYVLIFNGEIYNHLEIREEIKDDYVLKSTGDSETVLYAFIKYGISILNRLNGIFALAIYDREKQELIIARDHFGVKPLYIYSDQDQILFSSEIKAFLNVEIDKSIDYKALINYMTFLWSPGVMTPFLNVKKVLPGHYIKLSLKDESREFTQEVFYNSNFNGAYSRKNEKELIDELEKLLLAAVDRQLLSDVPVGFFLSGGLDSTLLVAMARKLYPDKKFPCFTIDIGNWGGFSDKFVNDIEYAKKSATFLDVDLHIVKADIDIVNDFDKMIWHLDEPQADAAPLNVLNIAKLARENGIKVLIGGTGGDDLFSGYRRHQALYYEVLISKAPVVVRIFLKKIISFLPTQKSGIRRLKKLFLNFDLSQNSRLKGYFQWLSTDKVKSLFNNNHLNSIQNYDPTLYFDQLSKEIPLEKSILNRVLYWELKTFLVDHNLNYTDKMSMAVGVEARTPYLDLDVVAFSQKLPPELKLKSGVTKYLLKKVAERYLPKEIIYRSKTGFGAPVRKWINEDLSEFIKDRLNPEKLSSQGIFNPEEINKLLEDNKSGKIDASYAIWSVLAIDSWFKQFAKSEKPSDAHK